jgi:hypothetical protein
VSSKLREATISINQLNFSKSKYGERRVIPITGGSFEGPNIKGAVLPGVADWQLVRPDGDLELYARYTSLVYTSEKHSKTSA